MATIDEIKQQAEAVKNATQVGENTAERVGGALSGLADIAEQHDSKLSGLRTLLSTNQYVVLGKKDGYIFSISIFLFISNTKTCSWIERLRELTLVGYHHLIDIPLLFIGR